MAKERRKIIRAGTLWMAVQYTAIRGGNQTARREARAQMSGKVQRICWRMFPARWKTVFSPQLFSKPQTLCGIWKSISR